MSLKDFKMSSLKDKLASQNQPKDIEAVDEVETPKVKVKKSKK